MYMCVLVFCQTEVWLLSIIDRSLTLFSAHARCIVDGVLFLCHEVGHLCGVRCRHERGLWPLFGKLRHGQELAYKRVSGSF